MYSHSWIDIAIVNYHGSADVAQCLASIGDWPHGTLWLIDNSECAIESQSLQDLVHNKAWIKLTTMSTNMGFAGACNWAHAQSGAKHLLLLNPDARIEGYAITELARYLDQRPNVGAISPKIFWDPLRQFLLPPAYALTFRGCVIDTMATWSRAMATGMAAAYLRRIRRQIGLPNVRVPFLAGAVLLLRRATLHQIGGLFDPGYFMFFEDADLSKRLRGAGFDLVVLNTVHAIHEYRHKASKAALMEPSRRYYLQKFHPVFARNFERIQRLAHPVDPHAWFDVFDEPIHNVHQFTELTRGYGVAALSPSILMRPCIFTASNAGAIPLDRITWNMLEPGNYLALLSQTSAPHKTRQVLFTHSTNST